MPVYLPTMAIVTSPSGFFTRSMTAFQRLMLGLGAGSMPKEARTARSSPAAW